MDRPFSASLALLLVGFLASPGGLSASGPPSAVPGEDWWTRLDRSAWPAPGSQVEAVIDAEIDRGLRDAGLDAAPRADAATLLRRVTLDLAGRIPVTAELDRFEAGDGAEPERFGSVVDGLLASGGFTRFLSDELNWLLMDGKQTDFRKYLAAALGEDIRWDALFAEVIAGQADAEGKIGVDLFLRDRVRDVDQMANDVSVKFFGVNISCAQCHDHPYVASWTQETYYGMKAFFGRTFENGGFAAERDYGTVSYKTTKGEEREALPRFLGADPIVEPPAKVLTEEEKKTERQQLEDYRQKKVAPPAPPYSRRVRIVEAGLSADHEIWFARSLVNRVWHRLMGQGLVMPLDQLHGQNAPSHPALLQWLAEDLVAHDYDLRRLTRGIVLSRAYQRSSSWEGDRPPAERFAVAIVRPLTPRQYGISLRVATSDPGTFTAELKPEDFEARLRSLEGAGESIAGRFERPGESFHVAVDEALYLSNNEGLDRQLLGGGLVPALLKVDDFSERTRMAFRSIFSRDPDPEEIEALRDYLASRSGDAKVGWEQIVWALLTSTEARFNH